MKISHNNEQQISPKSIITPSKIVDKQAKNQESKKTDNLNKLYDLIEDVTANYVLGYN